MEERKQISRALAAVTRILRDNHKQYLFDESDVKKLPSKKHTVLYLRLKPLIHAEGDIQSKFVIVKLFSEKSSEGLQRWEQEINNYNKLKKLNLPGKLPKRIDFARYIIIYEYIHGQEYRNLLLNNTLTSSQILKLAKWFSTLHQHNLIFFDSRLSNFMVSDNEELIIIDVEDIRPGIFSDDLPKLLSSFIDYTPGIFDGVYYPFFFNRMLDFIKYYCQFSVSLPKVLKSFKPEDPMTRSIPVEWFELIMKGLNLTSQRRNYSISMELWRKIGIGIKNSVNDRLSKSSE